MSPESAPQMTPEQMNAEQLGAVYSNVTKKVSSERAGDFMGAMVEGNAEDHALATEEGSQLPSRLEEAASKEQEITEMQDDLAANQQLLGRLTPGTKAAKELQQQIDAQQQLIGEMIGGRAAMNKPMRSQARKEALAGINNDLLDRTTDFWNGDTEETRDETLQAVTERQQKMARMALGIDGLVTVKPVAEKKPRVKKTRQTPAPAPTTKAEASTEAQSGETDATESQSEQPDVVVTPQTGESQVEAQQEATNPDQSNETEQPIEQPTEPVVASEQEPATNNSEQSEEQKTEEEPSNIPDALRGIFVSALNESEKVFFEDMSIQEQDLYIESWLLEETSDITPAMVEAYQQSIQESGSQETLDAFMQLSEGVRKFIVKQNSLQQTPNQSQSTPNEGNAQQQTEAQQSPKEKQYSQSVLDKFLSTLTDEEKADFNDLPQADQKASLTDWLAQETANLSDEDFKEVLDIYANTDPDAFRELKKLPEAEQRLFAKEFIDANTKPSQNEADDSQPNDQSEEATKPIKTKQELLDSLNKKDREAVEELFKVGFHRGIEKFIKGLDLPRDVKKQLLKEQRRFVKYNRGNKSAMTEAEELVHIARLVARLAGLKIGKTIEVAAPVQQQPEEDAQENRIKTEDIEAHEAFNNRLTAEQKKADFEAAVGISPDAYQPGKVKEAKPQAPQTEPAQKKQGWFRSRFGSMFGLNSNPEPVAEATIVDANVPKPSGEGDDADVSQPVEAQKPIIVSNENISKYMNSLNADDQKKFVDLPLEKRLSVVQEWINNQEKPNSEDDDK